MALTFNMSAPSGSKSKQFNRSQSQYLGNLAGFANQASATGADMLQGINTGLGKYEQATGDLAAMGGENLQRFINAPGYTPEEQRGMRMATTMPIESTYNTAGYQNRQRAALTGNMGASTAANAELARQKARDLSMGLSGLQTNIANARREDTTAGVNAMPGFLGAVSSSFQFPSSLRAGLYNSNLNAQMNALQGQQNATQQYMQRSMQPGFLKTAALTGIQGLVGGAGQKLLGLPGTGGGKSN